MADYLIGLTDKGKRRDLNEDAFVAIEAKKRGFTTACVIDGVGGYNGGEVAAALAASAIQKTLKDVTGDPIKAIIQAFVAANSEIRAAQREQSGNELMACVLTCVVADISANKFYYAHVGDTRLYLLRDKSLVKVSHDQSMVGFLEDSGRLSEEEAMRHPARNEINKALGFEDDITTATDFIETGESPFLPGDLLLLCSDGLTDMVPATGITSILTNKEPLPAKAKSLIEAANEAGGKDNITVVLLKNFNQPQALKPVATLQRKENNTSGSAPEVSERASVATNKKKKKNPVAMILALLLLLLGLSVVFMLTKKKPVEPTPQHIMPKPLHAMKASLTPNWSDSQSVYSLLTSNGIIRVNEPMLINTDSFALSGKGTRLIADSGYDGAAMIFGASSKQILLDSLTFENFTAPIRSSGSNITLRHVRFVNCTSPFQISVNFPDTIISGQLKDSLFKFQSSYKIPDGSTR